MMTHKIEIQSFAKFNAVADAIKSAIGGETVGNVRIMDGDYILEKAR